MFLFLNYCKNPPAAIRHDIVILSSVPLSMKALFKVVAPEVSNAIYLGETGSGMLCEQSFGVLFLLCAAPDQLHL